jgi:methionine sulfoxide reductase heme-binding subunit
MATARHEGSAPLSWLKPAVLTGSLVPFAVIAVRAATGRLGANPVATALNQLGLLALTFLVACLACTPLKIVFHVNWPIRLRRTLGLLAFFTAVVHFLVYAVLDQSLGLSRIARDVVRHPFVAVGFTALVLLVPLAVTSTKRSLTTMGFARWKRLHRLVYAIGVLAVVHFVMRVKADVREPYLWGAVVAGLYAVRVVDAARRPNGLRRRTIRD